MGCNCSRLNRDQDFQNCIPRGFKPLTGKFTGEGIKRTVAWIANISPGELKKKRNEFWLSRKQGQPEVWDLLRQACDADAATAEIMLELAEIYMETNMERCIDIQGNQYTIPPFVLNDPIPDWLLIAGESKKFKCEEIEIKVRWQLKVLELVLLNSTTVFELKLKFLDVNPEFKLDQLRFFFGGKELDDEQDLWHYNIENGVLVTVCIRPSCVFFKGSKLRN